MSGWIKLHRAIKDSSIFDNEKLLKVFIWCLIKATHKPHEQLVGRQKVPLNPGQFVTGRNKAGVELGMAASTAWDYLKILESNKSINIKSNNKFSIISIENWGLYQSDDENHDSKLDNKLDNKSTANQQQINTNKNDKNVKNDKEIYKDIVEYLNQKTNKNYKHTTKKTQTLIDARIKEGFTLEDFYKVIDNKVTTWTGTKWEKYLRPSTLFNGDKFEGYLNESGIKQQSTQSTQHKGNKFHNFEQQSSKYSADDLEEIARRKREHYFNKTKEE